MDTLTLGSSASAESLAETAKKLSDGINRRKILRLKREPIGSVVRARTLSQKSC